jgi:phenylalanyl-tRNA synthetase beta chain
MGGEESEVSADTQTVLLEAANFEQLGVLRSGERLHMRSESQTRWEKGVAPELAEPAANYATQLLGELTGARWDRPRRREGGLRAAARHPAPSGPRRGGRRHSDRGHRPAQRLIRLGFDVDPEWNFDTPYWRARDVNARSTS